MRGLGACNYVGNYTDYIRTELPPGRLELTGTGFTITYDPGTTTYGPFFNGVKVNKTTKGRERRVPFDEVTHRLRRIENALARQDQRLDDLYNLLVKAYLMSTTLATEITQLQTDVANETTVNASAITLINGFSAQLAAAIAAATAAGATPAQLTELTSLDAQIATNGAALAAAVTANTTPATPASTVSGATSSTP